MIKSDDDDSNDNKSYKDKIIENKVLIITNITSFLVGYGMYYRTLRHFKIRF